jgi:serine protease
VAGLRHIGTKVGYSSLGPEVSVAAPAGNCVNETGTCLYPLVTTTNTGLTTATADNTFSTGTTPTLGTSFSAPLVAGTAALMLSINPALSAVQLKAALQSTARPFPTTGAASDVSSCRAATNADQLECYCTTTTCGAGMLNTAQAVAKAQEPAVKITSSALATGVGSTATLDGQASGASLGRVVVGYAWSITSGAQNARFTGSTSGSTATLTGVAEGAVEVRLVVTDSLGASSASTLTLQITPAPPSGSGGGAWGLDGLLLVIATGAAWWLRRRARAEDAYTF